MFKYHITSFIVIKFKVGCTQDYLFAIIQYNLCPYLKMTV